MKFNILFKGGVANQFMWSEHVYKKKYICSLKVYV